MQQEPQPHGGTLTRPEKGQTPNPFGRPKKLLSVMTSQLKEAGYERVTAGMVVESIEALIGMSKEELEKLSTDAEQPMVVVIIAKALMSKKGLDALSSMLDRAHGKSKQKIDLAAEVTTPPILNIMLHGGQGATPTG